jgi:hypothetical protein
VTIWLTVIICFQAYCTSSERALDRSATVAACALAGQLVIASEPDEGAYIARWRCEEGEAA